MRQLQLRLNTEKIEDQRLSLLETNVELHLLNQGLQSSTEEITSNLEHISRLQTNLEIRENQYRGLVENAKDLIYELDENGRFSFVNTVMERVAGYDKEELLGKVYWDLGASIVSYSCETIFIRSSENHVLKIPTWNSWCIPTAEGLCGSVKTFTCFLGKMEMSLT
jgi:PAS domain-containing protein